MLKRLFQTPDFPNNEIKTLRAQLLSTTLNYFLAITAIVMIEDMVGNGIPIVTFEIELIAIVFYLVGRYTFARGYIEQVGVATLGIGFVVVTLAIINLGTVRSPTTSYYIVMTILAGMLYQRRGVLVLAGASSLATAALIVAEGAGGITPIVSGVSIMQWITFTLAFLLTGFMIATTVETAQKAVQRANGELIERKRAVEAMSSSETKFRSLVEQSLDGIAIVNQRGEIVTWNRAMEAIIGRPADQVIGSFTWDVQYQSMLPERKTAERYQQIKAMIVDALGRGEPPGPNVPIELAMMTPDGTQKTIESIVYPMVVQNETWLASIVRDVTDRKIAEQQLRESEERFHRMFEGHDAVMLLIEPESGQILDANQAACQYFGYSSEALKAMMIYEINLLPRDEHVRQRQMAMAGEKNCFIYQHRLANGEVRWVEAHSSPLVIQNQPALFVIIHDVTDRQQTAEALRETELRLRLTLEAAHVVAWEIEPQTGRMHDIGPVDKLFGQPDGFHHTGMEDWLAMLHPDDRHTVRAALDSAVAEASEYNVEYRLLLPNGSQRWIEATGRRMIDTPDRPVRLLGAARDISERKWAEQALYGVNEQLLAQVWKVEHLQQALREQAIRDPLSGLYNRWYLDEALQQEFARARRECHSISLIMMDIDHFKELNDTHGHVVGDEIIAKIGGRLKRACREGDIVCRYGGEEFVVVLRDVTMETALERAEQCRVAVQMSEFEVENLRLLVTVSAGVATYPQHTDNAVGLIRAADLALYRAKAGGRNCVILFDAKF